MNRGNHAGKTSKTFKEMFNQTSIQSMVFLSFTVSTVILVLLIGVSFYNRFSSQLNANVQEEKQILIDQVNQTLDSYLRNMMKLSDSLYYDVIKNTDLEEESVRDKMQLLYEVNKDHILNIALFDSGGELVESAPPAKVKNNVAVTGMDWFLSSREKTENLHFSVPSVQNVFVDAEYQYQWVISLSRAVEITRGKKTDQGMLLIDMKYSGIEQIFKNAKLGNNGYLYLVDSFGEIIYHPKRQLIASGFVEENHIIESAYRDGNYEETFQGEKRIVTVKSVGYTGWKIIGVTKEQNFSFNNFQNRVFVFFIFVLFVLILIIINSFISSKITNPIKELEKSVMALEGNMNAGSIYVGGSYEVQQLSKSIQNMVEQMGFLMKGIVREHESKRKSELDALQSQINPHFLYNTLDIIVWMVENERPAQAVKAVTALARFFRISLSRGKTVITVKDEIEHVRNYLMIQTMRYKNKFQYEILADEETLGLATLKLIIQPIVENSIYHGMEFMDGDGEIKIRAFCQGEDLFIKVTDNGFGMAPEKAASLLKRKNEVTGRGSGIGLWNIQERIHIYFGTGYGLFVESELDEGTTVTIHLPAISYEEVIKGEEKE